MGKIDIKYIDTNKHWKITYRPEYSGFVLSRKTVLGRTEAVLLSGSCFYKLDHLQRVINIYQNEV